VNGVNVGDLGGREDAGDIQVGARGFGRPDADGLIGEPHMQRVAIRLRVHRHGFNAEFLAGADDADRDLSPIGDENLAKHRRYSGRMENKASPYSTGLAFSTSLATTTPVTSASISFINFMDSMIQRTWPDWTVSPTFTNGGESGLDDS
jgi:hypothetical protein